MNNGVDSSRSNWTTYCRWNRISSRHPWNWTICYLLRLPCCCQQSIDDGMNCSRASLRIDRQPIRINQISKSSECVRWTTDINFWLEQKPWPAVGHQITHSINYKKHASISYHRHGGRDASSPTRLAKRERIFWRVVNVLYRLLQNGWSDGEACAQCSYFGKLFSVPEYSRHRRCRRTTSTTHSNRSYGFVVATRWRYCSWCRAAVMLATNDDNIKVFQFPLTHTNTHSVADVDSRSVCADRTICVAFVSTKARSHSFVRSLCTYTIRTGPHAHTHKRILDGLVST